MTQAEQPASDIFPGEAISTSDHIEFCGWHKNQRFFSAS
jgi:hypothetical protein